MYKLVTDRKATICPDGMAKPYEAFTDIMSKVQVEALSFLSVTNLYISGHLT